jgi:hypothetical protein
MGGDPELNPCLAWVQREQKAAPKDARVGAHFTQMCRYSEGAPRNGVPEGAPRSGMPERAPRNGVPEGARRNGMPERAPGCAGIGS